MENKKIPMDSIENGIELALDTINEKVGKEKPKQDKKGIIKCPVCGGKLHFTKSSYNGHVRN